METAITGQLRGWSNVRQRDLPSKDTTREKQRHSMGRKGTVRRENLKLECVFTLQQTPQNTGSKKNK